jgi:hypothetical protein
MTKTSSPKDPLSYDSALISLVMFIGINPGTNAMRFTIVPLVTQSVLTLVGGETSVVCNIDQVRMLYGGSRLKTYRQKLQDLVYDYHRRTQQQNGLPFDPVEWSDREHRLRSSRQRGEQLLNCTTHSEEGNV